MKVLMKWGAIFTAVLILTVSLMVGLNSSVSEASEDEVPIMNVDMTNELGELLHGASGFLYGISSEDVPTRNLIAPLKSKVLATKGALGTEHPYSDALDVAKTFLESGGEMVQMYNSNYYAIFGPKQYYQDYVIQLKEVIVPYVTEWKNRWKEEHNHDPVTGVDDLGLNIDKALVYLPINEGDSNRSQVDGDDFRQIFEAYYKAIKEVDPLATVGGMNPAEYSWTHVPPYWQWDGWHTWLSYLFENNALPDVVTWHQLERNENRYKADIEEFKHYRSIFAGEDNYYELFGKVNGVQVDKVPTDAPPIVINEIAQSDECGVPGALVSWIGRLEDAQAYGCLPFWHQANNLNDLAADSNEPNSAWWLYKWYADMSGERLEITTNDRVSGLYGVATIDNDAKVATTLFGLGSQDGDAKIVLNDIDKANAFKGSKKVHVTIDATFFKGFNSVSTPETVLDGIYALEDGDLIIEMTDMLRSTGYRLTVTPAKESDVIGNIQVGPFHNIYEAEEAARIGNGNLGVVTSGKYFLSGRRASKETDDENRIGGSGLCNFTSNRGIEYEIEVPVDGRYSLEFIYGNQVGMNRGNETEHKPTNQCQTLIIDGEESEMILKNTMEREWTAIYTRIVEWKAGTHTIQIMGGSSSPESNILHDALHVTEVTGDKDNVYEAEEADFSFNAINSGINPVKINNDIKDYTGNGYVSGLNLKSVKDGGGVRWSVIVDKSGLYNLDLRYQSDAIGKATVYIGNAARTFDGYKKEVRVLKTNGKWSMTNACIYLEKGVNIVDLDSSVNIYLDNLCVTRSSEAEDYIEVVNAEDSVPELANLTGIEYDVWSVRWNEDYIDNVFAGLLNGAEPYAVKKQVNKIEETVLTPDGEIFTYVVGRSLTGDINAENEVDKHLEFEINVPKAGRYALQIFHSNDEIYGTHGYNTKIIDKFANIKVNDQPSERYFFINTISRDTFKEKTVYIDLKEGINTIKIFNDDSWSVMKGLDDGQAKSAGLPDWRIADPNQEVTGSYSSYYFDKPGNIPIVNSLPNFSKFVITPMSLGSDVIIIEPTDVDTQTQIETSLPIQNQPMLVETNTITSFNSGKLSYKVLSYDGKTKRGTVEVTGGKNNVKVISIPNKVSHGGGTYRVIRVANSAFRNNKKITKVSVGKNVRQIGSDAFRGCTKLIKLKTGTSLTRISNRAFYGDKKLRTIDLTKSKKIKWVGKKAFKGISKKVKVNSPKNKVKVYNKLIK